METRMLLIGDRQVGKTSLILSLVNEQFTRDVPAKLDEVFIPGDVTRQNIPTCIVDYSSREQDEITLEMEIRRANVIIVVYAVDKPSTLQSTVEKWLPLVEQNRPRRHDGSSDDSDHDQLGNKPVILAGNKVDLTLTHESEGGDGGYLDLDAARHVMDQFDAVETCVEVSAMTLQNISELFYHAQKAVLYPSAPLYDYNGRKLRQSCKRALQRIFRICDSDNDNLLSDAELAAFQERCFFVDLTAQTLSRLKEVVRRCCPPEICGLVTSGRQKANKSDRRGDELLTLDGFYILVALLIERGRHETVWTFLRRFGYDDDLRFDHNYFHPELKLQDASSCLELSQEGLDFLIDLFDRYDQDEDDALSPHEFKRVFETCPGGHVAWGREYQLAVECNASGWINGTGFLAMWTLAACHDAGRTVELLAHLGYPFCAMEDNALGALRVTRRRHASNQHNQHGHRSSSSRIMSASSRRTTHQINRTVFNCFVLGTRSSGKTTMCRNFVNPHNARVRSVCSSELDDSTASSGPGGTLSGSSPKPVSRDDGGVRQRQSSLRHSASIDVVELMQTSDSVESRSPSNLNKTASYINAIEVVQDGAMDVYLILEDTEVEHTKSVIARRSDECDVFCLLYDVSNPRSFEYCARIYLKYLCQPAVRGDIPILFVGNKSDLPAVRQDYELQPDEFCTAHQLAPPVQIAATKGIRRDFFRRLANMAVLPDKYNKEWKLHSASKRMGNHDKSKGRYYLLPTGIVLTLGVTTFAIFVVGGIAVGRYVQSR